MSVDSIIGCTDDNGLPRFFLGVFIPRKKRLDYPSLILRQLGITEGNFNFRGTI